MVRKQPKALYLLFFAEMWEYFNIYAMRVLLVLYMIEQLHMSDYKAFGIYALFLALLEVGAIGGGYVADRIFGLRPSIVFGGALIAAGQLCLAVENGRDPFFIGLGLIVTGTTLFNANIKALLGLFYEEKDSRREAGFTFYYTGINVGGFLAALVCGWIAQIYGKHVGFALASGGMLLALGCMVCFKRLLEGKGEAPEGVSVLKKGVFVSGALCVPFILTMILRNPSLFTPFLPLAGVGTLGYIGHKVRKMSSEVQRGVRLLMGLVVLVVIYFMFEELTGSLLIVFCERHVDRLVFSHVIPSSLLVAMNPLTIVVFGLLLAKVRKGKEGVDAMERAKRSASLAIILLGCAFMSLCVGGVFPSTSGEVSIGFVVLGFLLIASGELFIVPVVYSFCTQVAPKKMEGALMALVIMGFAYAGLLSGTLSKVFSHFHEKGGSGGELALYTQFFALAAGLCIAVGGSMRLFSYIQERIRLRNERIS